MGVGCKRHPGAGSWQGDPRGLGSLAPERVAHMPRQTLLQHPNLGGLAQVLVLQTRRLSFGGLAPETAQLHTTRVGLQPTPAAGPGPCLMVLAAG